MKIQNEYIPVGHHVFSAVPCVSGPLDEELPENPAGRRATLYFRVQHPAGAQTDPRDDSQATHERLFEALRQANTEPDAETLGNGERGKYFSLLEDYYRTTQAVQANF